MRQGIVDGFNKLFRRKDKQKPIKTINQINDGPMEQNASRSKSYRPTKRGRNKMIQSSNSFLKHSIRTTKAWL